MRRQAGPDMSVEENHAFRGEYETDTRPSRVTLQPISEAKKMQGNSNRGHSYGP